MKMLVVVPVVDGGGGNTFQFPSWCFPLHTVNLWDMVSLWPQWCCLPVSGQWAVKAGSAGLCVCVRLFQTHLGLILTFPSPTLTQPVLFRPLHSQTTESSVLAWVDDDDRSLGVFLGQVMEVSGKWVVNLVLFPLHAALQCRWWICPSDPTHTPHTCLHIYLPWLFTFLLFAYTGRNNSSHKKVAHVSSMFTCEPRRTERLLC